jgi:hypothetical protein
LQTIYLNQAQNYKNISKNLNANVLILFWGMDGMGVIDWGYGKRVVSSRMVFWFQN